MASRSTSLDNLRKYHSYTVTDIHYAAPEIHRNTGKWFLIFFLQRSVFNAWILIKESAERVFEVDMLDILLGYSALISR